MIEDLVWKGNVDLALDYKRADQDTDGCKWDCNRYLMGKTVQFLTHGDVGRPLSGPSEYSLDARMGLRYKVNEWASLNLKTERNVVQRDAQASLNKPPYTAGFGVVW